MGSAIEAVDGCQVNMKNVVNYLFNLLLKGIFVMDLKKKISEYIHGEGFKIDYN